MLDKARRASGVKADIQIIKNLNDSLIMIVRIIFSTSLLFIGVYWFFQSSQDWIIEGFPIFTSGEKGKDIFSGILFSTAFISYGIWEITRIIKENRKNHRE